MQVQCGLMRLIRASYRYDVVVIWTPFRSDTINTGPMQLIRASYRSDVV